MEDHGFVADCKKVLDSFILSASGWRTVFSMDGDEENQAVDLATAHRILAGLMAQSFLDRLTTLTGKQLSATCIAVGSDTRPTGPAIIQAMLPVLIASEAQIRVVGVSAAPELMAWSRCDKDIDCFIYISASHNPVGHNGVKFGLNTGGVINSEQIKPMISRFKELSQDPAALQAMKDLQAKVDHSVLARLLAESRHWKPLALQAYQGFSTLVIADCADPTIAAQRLAMLAEGITKRPIGIVGDLNGSARAASIDQNFLTDLGVKTHFIHDQAGEIAHRIVPEGSSLDECRQALADAHTADPDFILGYMPDNDGDRGNLVYVDSASSSVKALEAQEVFALCCLAELAYLVHSGQLRYDAAGMPIDKVAIAVNDPTSLRIDELAESFGAKVFRAEVGEANVVNLASRLRDEGYVVRILGEGSNGGNITHPAAVRDPLNTIASMLKLLTMTGGGGPPGLFEIWCSRRGISCPTTFGLTEIMATLPGWVTTSAYEDKAILRIRSMDHAGLKKRYEALFLSSWETDRHELNRRFGIVDWAEFNYEGTVERAGFGPGFRTGAERGGFRIVFRDGEGQAVGMIWMRGSGTEPVFRVAAEVRGKNSEDESWLLGWHKSLILRADAESETVQSASR